MQHVQHSFDSGLAIGQSFGHQYAPWIIFVAFCAWIIWRRIRRLVNANTVLQRPPARHRTWWGTD